jgi:hypothetical protein
MSPPTCAKGKCAFGNPIEVDAEWRLFIEKGIERYGI